MPADQASVQKIHPVILSGGSGTRLWPMSRSLYPKQFLALTSSASMLQETVRRATGPRFAAPLVIANDKHRFIVAEQLRALDMDPARIVLEPVGRNTAPAAAVAALLLTAEDADAVMMVLPSDHTILEPARFYLGVEIALPAARDGRLMTFGIRPSGPETGYGYVRQGDAIEDRAGCFEVSAFVEKPDLERAEAFVASSEYHWNSGMFMFAAQTYLDELQRLQPEIVAACRAAIENAAEDLDFLRLDRGPLEGATSLSIDYAVMEHADRVAVVPIDIGWNDVGSWSALWEIGEKDGDGNVITGDVIALDVARSFILSDHKLVAAVGLEDMVVIVTDDAILVAGRDSVQNVKEVVETLRRDGRTEQLHHTTIYRPWGSYQSIDVGDRFQVKRITVKPGARLSLQKHHHRAEHWIVVHGTAKVTRGKDEIILHENESTYIPLGAAHRLENPRKVPLQLIEVQSGSYLGEDDIVRLNDVYGRT